MKPAQSPTHTAQDILNFWFSELTPDLWFKQTDEVDETIRNRYKTLHQQASQCELWSWRTSAEGRLAEIIILDQFSRNLYRGQPQAFASDPLAMALAQEAVALQVENELSSDQIAFLYMPYMHSESRVIQQESLRLFSRTGLENYYPFALSHQVIVERFGYYPHRNEILGRPTSAEEAEFLKQPGSSF